MRRRADILEQKEEEEEEGAVGAPRSPGRRPSESGKLEQSPPSAHVEQLFDLTGQKCTNDSLPIKSVANFQSRLTPGHV